MNQNKIFIAGCGGLGSNLAIMLARSNFDNFILADFDRVEQSNLNRQHFFPCDLGKPKAETLSNYMKNLNKNSKIFIVSEKLSEDNFANIIDDDCVAVCECFDNSQCKAHLTRFMLLQRPETLYIAVSGIAGMNVESLKIEKKSEKFYLVTDNGLEGDVNESGVFAPKVVAAAALQASIILRKLV